MAIFGSLSAFLKADSTQWQKGFGEARAEVDKTENKTKSYLANLKSNFGKGSQMAQILKLAAGGGAIAGLSLAGKTFAHMGEMIGQASINLRNGVDGASQEMLYSIPILGNVAKGWNGILEALTGDEAAFQQRTKS